MEKYFSLFVTLAIAFSFSFANAQTLYIKTFGSPDSKPIIFLHGGPGYNSANFEASSAQKLSENGFFVIVYDRRGEGRSEDAFAKFTFEDTFGDIDNIYKKYGLEKASLIGHSFGGIVGALFTEKYPDKVNSLVLVSAPVSLQESFKTILRMCKNIYADRGDSVGLSEIGKIESMDTTSLMYSSACFKNAMANGFYSPKSQTEEAKNIYSSLKSSELKNYFSQMTIAGPIAFWKNENYTTIDLSSNIENLVKRNVKVYGLYGKDDGLYSPEQVASLEKIIGAGNLNYYDNCSHSVYVDRQSLFIEALKSWMNF